VVKPCLPEKKSFAPVVSTARSRIRIDTTEFLSEVRRNRSSLRGSGILPCLAARQWRPTDAQRVATAEGRCVGTRHVRISTSPAAAKPLKTRMTPRPWCSKEILDLFRMRGLGGRTCFPTVLYLTGFSPHERPPGPGFREDRRPWASGIECAPAIARPEDHSLDP